MKALLVLLSATVLLASCVVTPEDLELTEPEFSMEYEGDVAALRDCLFDWTESSGFAREYAPNGLIAKTPSSQDVGVIMKVQSGRLNIYIYDAFLGQLDEAFETVGKSCIEDTSSKPPLGFWG